MKKLITVIALFPALAILSSFQTANDNALARISKTEGRLVFYHNEPVNNYDVVFTYKDQIKDFDCNTISKNIEECVRNANMEAGQQGKLYDAVIIGQGERDIAISFTDKTKDNSIARVKREGGILLFLGCEPVNAYDIVKKLDVSGEGWKAISGKCPSWEQKTEKLLKKVDKKKNNCDAIILGDTKYDFLITFKK